MIDHMDRSICIPNENPYASPRAGRECRHSIAWSVTLFFIALPLVIFGCQGVVAVCYWLIIDQIEMDYYPRLSLLSAGASCLLVVGLWIWNLADKVPSPKTALVNERKLME